MFLADEFGAGGDLFAEDLADDALLRSELTALEFVYDEAGNVS